MGWAGPSGRACPSSAPRPPHNSYGRPPVGPSAHATATAPSTHQPPMPEAVSSRSGGDPQLADSPARRSGDLGHARNHVWDWLLRLSSGQAVLGWVRVAREVRKLLILNPVGVNIGVKPRFSWPLGMEVAEIEPSLVGPVGIEPTTCGLKVRCSRKLGVAADYLAKSKLLKDSTSDGSDVSRSPFRAAVCH